VVHRNGTAEVFVGKGVSFGYWGFRLLVELLFKYELSCGWSQVCVTNAEFNRDFQGLQLDGVQGVTLRAFDGSFRRLYNHGKDVLRDEVKMVGSKTISDVLALMSGNIPDYNILPYDMLILTRLVTNLFSHLENIRQGADSGR